MKGLNNIARAGLLCAIALLGPVCANNVYVVQHGHSIQTAINAARPGERIVVEAGIYAEQLIISQNGVHLVGKKGAVIVPPSKTPAKPNGCTGLAGPNTVAGICIIGTNIKFADFVSEHRKVLSVGKYVRDVTVEGFEIRGFSGLNIAVVGATNAEVRGNTVTDGTAYGILTVGSRGSLITRNAATSPSVMFIGICMDDQSEVTVSQNSISNYFIGLCVQTNRADVAHNKVDGCCFGAFIDPLVDGARVTHNHIGATNPLCGANAHGIIIAGAVNSDVSHNDISGINDGGNATNIAAGILIYDDPSSAASGNVVTFNALENNEQDLLIYSAGGKNQVKHNHCSTPEDLCRKQ